MRCEAAVAATGATIAFDAIGDGGLPNTILHAMEAAANRTVTVYSRYGSANKLMEAGHDEVADRLETEVVGRNVLNGRWTFQIVEEFDDGYWSVFRDHERRVRDELQKGQRHVFESEMKDRRRTHGHAGHERRPSE